MQYTEHVVNVAEQVINIWVFSDGSLPEKVSRNFYENLWLKISEIVLLNIFDNNWDVGICPTGDVDFVKVYL